MALPALAHGRSDSDNALRFSTADYLIGMAAAAVPEREDWQQSSALLSLSRSEVPAALLTGSQSKQPWISLIRRVGRTVEVHSVRGNPFGYIFVEIKKH